jgi:alanyl-tRNA synthetase
MRSDELRQLYIDFFVEKGHLHLPGAPLVPIDALGVEDRSTLFTSAGMQQFKPYFTGEAVPPSRRVVTVQKCVRTGDIDSVGDYAHCTFFEMLGNFSFGDYFKAEVIPWTWEFLTERLRLDPDRMCVTVFKEDDEAFDIWHKAVGLPEDRIHRLGEDKNYWPANAISEGPNGPCGPCTEIFYRVAPLEEMTPACAGAGSDPTLTPAERYRIDDDAGRWLEIWNNVFTQYNRSEDERGKPLLLPLPNKNNDTGAGFERILCLMQNVPNLFKTDLFQPAMTRIEELANRSYGDTMSASDFAFRVVAEHTRTAVFCIADGILPLNEGRGYVLRRIIRRAIRYGKTVLGFDEPFMHEIAPATIEAMGGHYREIVDRREHILKTLLAEEERFRRTLDNGMRLLNDLLELPEVRRSQVVPGGKGGAFLLYDTFGFPLEVTEEIAAERGMTVDREAFGREMEEQRKRSRDATGIDKDVFRSLGAALVELQHSAALTEFVGYKGADCPETKVLALIKGGELVDFARAGDEVEIVLGRTPFYAEAGGQIGDTGLLTAPGLKIEVTDTQKAGGIYLHKARVLEGEVTTDQAVRAEVDITRRRHIMRNHTATHLLHAALRETLGKHVHQKGSLVAPDRLRFDFTHNQPMTDEELRRVEGIVNARILEDAEVKAHPDVPIAEAKARGAMALFGEKYGDRVRMIEIPGFSLELCGGTHLSRTSQVGLFKIVSETGIAAGVRRIEAVTGKGAYEYVVRQEETLAQAAQLLKSNPRDILVAAEKLAKERAALEKQVRQIRTGAAGKDFEVKMVQIGELRVVTGHIPNADSDILAAQADRTINQYHGGTVVVYGGDSGGKVTFVAKGSAEAVQHGFHAGNLVREVAKVAGGGGGGRPDFAQAGGRDPSKLDEALAKVLELVAQQAGGAG